MIDACFDIYTYLTLMMFTRKFLSRQKILRNMQNKYKRRNRYTKKIHCIDIFVQMAYNI